jgi:hypothetical protein
VGKDTGKYAGWTLNSHYRQRANITLAANSPTWIMIGNIVEPFSGVYDGNGHTITGLTIRNAVGQFIGMFGSLGAGGTVKNLGLVNVSISGNTCVGGVAGGLWKGGVVSNCFVTGNVSGINRVGGVVGQNSGGTIMNCFSAANVTAVTSAQNLSGSVGIVGQGGSVTQAMFASGDAGGVAGSNSDSGIVSNCYASGNVSGYKNVGGVVGFNNGTGTVKNCVALSPAITRNSGADTRFGRVVGDSTGTCIGSYARNDMRFAGITQGATSGSAHGTNVAVGTYKTQAFWTGTMGWSFGSSAGKPWKWDSTSGLPVLWFR